MLWLLQAVWGEPVLLTMPEEGPTRAPRQWPAG